MSRFAFAVHPLAPFHRPLLGVRRGHLPLASGGSAGIDAVGVVARLAIPTAAGDAQGVIIAVPDLARALIADQARALQLQIRAARVAEAEGARALGLGNALAIVAGRGAALAAEVDLPVTTGQAATAWACAETVRRAWTGGPVGVLGFAGAVGDAVAAVLRASGLEVWVDAPEGASGRRARALGCVGLEAADVVRRCRLLVGASTTGPTLDPDWLRPDTTLVDLALPPTLRDGPRPPGLRVLAGEALAPPARLRGGVCGSIWLGLAGYGRGVVYACLAEPLAMAMTGERGFSAGRRLDPDRVRAVGAALQDLGFRPVQRARDQGP